MKSRIWLTFLFVHSGSCTIKFDVTSQRTALENQILGTQKELDQDVVLISSVRAVDQDGEIKKIEASDLHQKAVLAKQNQAFNQDDIQEFKDKQFIGEGPAGKIMILPPSIGLVSQASNRETNIISIILAEENRDRKIIWRRVITMNPELNSEHFDSVVETFQKQIYEKAKPGHWFYRNGRWMQKP
ncbi:DUF1318 domain-containing protein [Pseudobacteriovorax antillogorgiicola]|uniref:DUF1318 domain-containing protein n=1 Tax=Pseudobacteriovorax antillogorgiicola TaxID=1513793 RepID=A0A1Y6CHS4_9BACT|nr:DUF1318 domain-containing protein [Pseudobacteriovorax antillogorgiicola]TCS46644.1 uncharacterized protein DUF1318 [Pseudobacteriovorax antillogorgiicola]SMF66310.1 Protein of unknown function [Pseudobacteriovorax antillogorgiicola]